RGPARHAPHACVSSCSGAPRAHRRPAALRAPPSTPAPHGPRLLQSQSNPPRRSTTMPAAQPSKDTRQLEAIAALALEEAQRQGASEAEADVSVSQGLSVSVRRAEVDTIEYERDRGLAVTVYFGKRKGPASTAALAAAAVRQTVEKACAIARYTTEDP